MPLFTRKNPDRPELPKGHNDQSSPWYVAPDLRDDYLAHTPTFNEIKGEVTKIIKERGKLAVADTLKAEGERGNLMPEWRRREAPSRSPVPGMPGPQELAQQRAKSARESVDREGEQEGDAELAEHRARLTFAKRCKAERDEAERAERKRQDARCRMCNALDVPTAPAVFTLTPAPHSHKTPSVNNKARTYTVGDGPVCAHCRVVVIADETARIADQRVDGVTRAELAKRFLRGSGT